MAWNDPPSFSYQQLTNPGRKFKHRYVSNDTKLGQPQLQHSQQSLESQPNSSLLQNQQFQQQDQYDFRNLDPRPLQQSNYGEPNRTMNNLVLGTNSFYNNGPNHDQMLPTSPPTSFPSQPTVYSHQK